MDSHVFDTTETLLAALFNEFSTLPQLKQLLEETKCWPKTVASLQTLDEAKRATTLLLAALIHKLDCLEQLDRETAPDVEVMAPILRKLVACNMFAMKLRRLMNGLLNEPMPTYLLPKKLLVSKVKEHRGKVKIPQNIATVDALELWMQQNQVFNNVAGIERRLVFKNAAGTAINNYLGDEEKIYCSIDYKKEVASMYMALILTLARTMLFGVYSLRKMNGPVSLQNQILDAVIVLIVCFYGLDMFRLIADCRATGNMTPLVFTLFALGFAIASTFFGSWTCIAFMVSSLASIIQALMEV